MDYKLRQEIQQEIGKALDRCKASLQVAITICCFSIGASLGVAVISSPRPVAAIGLGLAIGAVAAVVASYSMYRFELRNYNLREAEKMKNIDGQDRGYHGGDYANDSRSNL